MPKQLDLFSRYSLNINHEVKEAMSASAKDSGLSREDILERMNRLAAKSGVRLLRGNGSGLTMATFEKWLNAQAAEHYPPFNSLVIFCAAINDYGPIKAMTKPLGIKLIEEEDIKLLMWAKEYHQIKTARKRIRKLQEEL